MPIYLFRWDHPRPCGEKADARGDTRAREGSPPPMRGKVCDRRLGGSKDGITPAHAGKRICLSVTLRCAQDHPRPCGEKICAIMHMPDSTGSPPPMRGKVWRVSGSVRPTGITPAHAGKSQSHRTGRNPGRDHPRPCGEKRIARTTMLVNIGSPPPMRGKVAFDEILEKELRITPAHAGKSHHAMKILVNFRDHPRPCGEKSMRMCVHLRAQGSPPPMRGKVTRVI